MKPTTEAERQMLIGEIQDEAMGTIQEWLRRWMREDSRADSPGEEIRLRYYEDGSTVVELDDEPVMEIQFSVEILATDFTDKHNEPIGGAIPRTWGTVPAGWFVKTPKGDWLEVTSTALVGEKQFVGLRIQGEVSHWNRDPKGEVTARRGSLSPRDRDDAMAALEEAFTTAILQDEPPGQS